MRDKLSRRVAIKTTAAASIGIASGAFGDPKGSTKDLIREENAKKGTRDWRLTEYQNRAGEDQQDFGQRTLQGDRRLLQREQPAGWRKA